MGTNAVPDRKKERLEARIPSTQKSLLQRAAGLQGQSLSEFVVSSATREARRVIRDADVLELSQRDQVVFANALLNPPEAAEPLKAEARKYRERMQ
jgi:uncharacterized protein (DUF1778 family)